MFCVPRFWAWFGGIHPADDQAWWNCILAIFADPSCILNGQLITSHKSGSHCQPGSPDGEDGFCWPRCWFFRLTKLGCFSHALCAPHWYSWQLIKVHATRLQKCLLTSLTRVSLFVRNSHKLSYRASNYCWNNIFLQIQQRTSFLTNSIYWMFSFCKYVDIDWSSRKF